VSEASLRVALLDHADRTGGGAGGEGHAPTLAAALRVAGHEPRVLSSRGRAPRALDWVLRRRGFTVPIAHLPASAGALAAGGYHVAHAFSPPDALAALAWRRLFPCIVVFTCAETLGRETVADRRLRMWAIEQAVRHADAFVAATEESRSTIERWLALDVPVLEPRDAAVHERLYRALLGTAGQRSGVGA
jgi:hypothetical protein